MVKLSGNSVSCVSGVESGVFSRLIKNIFPFKILNFSHSFKITFLNIVVVWSRFTHSVRCSFFNILSMSDPVGATHWPSDSGCRDADRSKFNRCVDGREPEVNEVWIWGEYGIAPKVHPTTRVDVEAGVVYKFTTNYHTENGFKTSIFCKKSINGNFESLRVPYPLRTNGPYWIDNILVSIQAWVVGGTVVNLN